MVEEREITFSEFQADTAKTEQEKDSTKALLIAALGLTGEVGGLLAELKKAIRDGERYKALRQGAAEEIGDILWYLSRVSDHLGIDLNAAARLNLQKTNERWPTNKNLGQGELLDTYRLFDAGYPEDECLPREFKIEFSTVGAGPNQKVQLRRNGQVIGDALRDNTYEDSGYRYHDVFHFSYCAVLGWSPVTRSLLKHKRRSKLEVDEVEDGGRASVIEEGIAALVYSAASQGDFYERTPVEFQLLKMIRQMTKGLEVHERSYGDWEKAILTGYSAFRKLRKWGKGAVGINMKKRSLTVTKQK